MECTADKFLAWITAISFLTSIILTFIAICLSYHISKQNKKLQKEIHNRDIRIQYMNNALSIYNDFIESIEVINKKNTVSYIFSNEHSSFAWSNDLYNGTLKIHKACNRANILFNDSNFIKYLSMICNSYNDIVILVNQYIVSGSHLQIIQNARQNTYTKFGILPKDYYHITIHMEANRYLISQCENEVTRNIESKINIFLNLVNSDEFHNAFKKYIVLSEIPINENEKTVIATIGDYIRTARNSVIGFFHKTQN